MKTYFLNDWQDEKVSAFNLWLQKNTGIKDNSRNQYVHQIRGYFHFLNESGIADITSENINQYLLLKTGKKKDRIVYCRRFAMQQFLRFSKMGHDIQSIKSYLRPESRRYERYIKFSAFKKMLDGLTPELHCILTVLYDTGIRIAPIVNMKSDDIKHDDKGHYIFVKEKRGKLAERYFEAHTLSLLKPFMAGKDKSGYLFRLKIKLDGKERWETFSECYYRLWSGLKNQSRLFIGNYGISFHWVRTSRAKELYRRLKDLSKVQKFLGHENISTTMIYTDEGGLNSAEIIQQESGKWG